MTVKVSVVIPTYNSGPGLVHLVASLDRQSLPPGEFEAIFVDDGSTDDTWNRLQEIAATRTNVHTERIPNSGWPGRPRNIGTDRAAGEYVVYMDHDDELFPESLERWYDFAVANRSDVVLGKEVRTSNPLGWETFRRTIPRLDKLTGSVLNVLTPHKLYRRAFLVEEGIRFPEGPTRLEDHVFNVQVYTRAKVVSVLADYPCYRWIIHQDNSSTKLADPVVYWGAVSRSLELLEAGTQAGAKRDVLLMRWYAGQVLRVVGPPWRKWPADYRAQVYPLLRQLLDRWFPVRLDARLPPAARARAVLLRADDEPALVQLAELDAGVRAVARRTSVRWENGALVVSAEAELVDRSGSPLPLRRDGDRILRVLPPPLAARVRDSALDVTAALAGAKCEMAVTARTSRVEWRIPGDGSVSVMKRDDAPVLVGRIEGRIDPSTAAYGRPMDPDVWNVSVRLAAFGFTSQPRVPADGLGGLAALVDGRPVVAYATRDKKLSLDLDGSLRTVAGSGRIRVEDAEVERVDGRIDVTIRLPRVHVRGRTAISGEVLLNGDPAGAAELVGDEAGARLTGRVAAAPATYALATRLPSRIGETGLSLVVSADAAFVAPGGRSPERSDHGPEDSLGSATTAGRVRLAAGRLRRRLRP